MRFGWSGVVRRVQREHQIEAGKCIHSTTVCCGVELVSRRVSKGGILRKICIQCSCCGREWAGNTGGVEG